MAERLTTAQRRFLERVRDGKVLLTPQAWAFIGPGASCIDVAREMHAAGLAFPPGVTSSTRWILSPAGREALDG